MAHAIPGTSITPIYEASDDLRHALAKTITRNSPRPAVVIEDTHPAPSLLPSCVQRVLVVRPTSFDYVCALHDQYDLIYQTVWIADHAESPTWFLYAGRVGRGRVVAAVAHRVRRRSPTRSSAATSAVACAC